MAKYSNTKAKINEKITTNSAQAITGNVLNEVLQTMVDSLGADYQFGGLVQPGSAFTAGEQPVVFLATTPGTYTNFGSIVVADGEVALLVWSGTAWSKQTPDIATRTEVSQLGQEIIKVGQKRSVRLDWYDYIGYFINSSNQLEVATDTIDSVLIQNVGYGKLTIQAGERNTSFSFLTSNDFSSGISFCSGETGRHNVSAGESVTAEIPVDCRYINIIGKNYSPQLVTFYYNTDVLENLNIETEKPAMKKYFANKTVRSGVPQDVLSGQCYLRTPTDGNDAFVEVRTGGNRIISLLDGDIVESNSFNYRYEGNNRFDVQTQGEQFSYFRNGYFKYLGNNQDVEFVADNSWRSCSFRVKPGDVLFYFGQGGNTSRLFIYKDLNNIDIEIADAQAFIPRYCAYRFDVDGFVYLNFNTSANYDVKTPIISKEQLISKTKNLLWEDGAIDSYSGALVNRTNRIRTSIFQQEKQLIVVPDGYQIYFVIYYDLSDNFQSSVSVGKQFAYVGLEDRKYKLVVAKIDSTQNITSIEFCGTDSFVSPFYKQTDFGRAPFAKYRGLQLDYTFGQVGVTKTLDVYAAYDSLVDNDYLFKRSIGIANGVEQFVYYTKPALVTESQLGAGFALNYKKNPTIVFVQALHGNEQSNVFGMYYLVKDLCENYMDDDVLRFIHQYVSLVVFPVSNPYGFDNVVYYNENHVNLNRNWDVVNWFDPSGGDPTSDQYAGVAPFDQLETLHIKDCIQTYFPNADIIIDNHMRDNSGQPSPVDSLIWVEMPRWDYIKDSFTWLFYQSCGYHINDMTPQFHYDYGQYIGGQNRDLVGTLLLSQASRGVGQLNAWASQHGFLSLTIEGFAGFPLDASINTNDLVKKANCEALGNFIATACGYLAKYPYFEDK